MFSRNDQDWRLQKRSNNLILAVRRDHFLYEGKEITPDFGNQRFFYNALVLNCIYDCDYCYLQGMFPSANVVMFVNHEDYLAQTALELEKGPMYLAISYDTDLLAFENIIPYSKNWIDFTRNHPDLTIEIRTKSSNFRSIKQLEPAENVILAWTLSPDEIIEKYEKKTPPLRSRLRALNDAIEAGWQVRICFDPMLKIPGWENYYSNMVEQVMNTIPYEKVRDFSIGVFRMNKEYLRRIRRHRTDTDILFQDFEVENGISTYHSVDRRRMETLIAGKLAKYISEKRIDII